jgi:uncharacterized ferritin-like protein (DUF455 family)
MELREWATRILSGDTLEEKLLDPGVFTDHTPGPAIRWKEPTRPQGLGFHSYASKHKLPRFHEHGDLNKRADCLHRFAGHELLAVEIMAYTLLAFPDAPKNFRLGVAHTLKEEQWHVKLYIQRLEAMGFKFGDFLLFRHFWAYVPHITSPLRYVSLMSLTFEMANLDFAPLYGASFAQYGDEASSALMKTILEDEIRHVSFGSKWFEKLKDPTQNSWDLWVQNLPSRMGPSRAKTQVGHFFEENRRMAGVPDDWIKQLKNA